MKILIKYLTVIIFFIISIYYTEKSMNKLRTNDPILNKIKSTQDKYNIEPVNAYISDNNITPGKNGQEVDIKKSYKEMQKYGSYNETLIKIKEVKPTISLTNNKDKYINLTTNNDKKVSFLFIINNNQDINNLLKILNRNKIIQTLYIKKDFIEENIKLLKETNQDIELLVEDKKLFKINKSYLETIINNKINYCYTEEENDEILKLCEKNNMYTIKPSIIIKNNLYKNVKSNIETSKIFSIYLNKYTEKELDTTIKFLIKKGYEFCNLNTLLSENK